jgi:hypothetical protein
VQAGAPLAMKTPAPLAASPGRNLHDAPPDQSQAAVLPKTPLRASAFTILDVGLCIIPTVFVSAAISIASGAIAWRAIIVLFAIYLGSLALGRAVFTLQMPAFRAAGEFLAGALLGSLIILGMCSVFTISAGTAAGGAAIISIGAAGLSGRRTVVSTSRADLLLMLLVCLAAFIWSWQAMHAVPRLLASGRFDAWVDYFIHAGEISQFADFGPLHGTTIFASGAPLPLYHYGSYMFSAVLSGLAGVSALAAATSCWTPFGFILLGLAAAVLGGVLAGETGGFLAVAVLMLVPSASHYGLQNPFFDFHWLLQISSSGSYGIACAGLSVCALILWLRGRAFAALAWAAFFTLATFEFRVQVFAPLALSNALIWLLAWRPARPWWRPALVLGGLLIVFGCMFGLQRIQRAPHFFTAPHDPVHLLLLMHGMLPNHYGVSYAHLAATLSHGTGLRSVIDLAVVLGVGIFLLLGAAFGVLLPFYLAALLLRRRGGQRLIEDLIPLAGLLAYVMILVSFPSNPEEKLEFAHRPYVLVYALLAIWCARFAADLIPPAAWRQPAAAALAFGLLITPLSLQAEAQLSGLEWRAADCDFAVPPGLIASALYVHVHAAAQAAVAIPPSPLDNAFIALSEHPSFYPGDDFLAVQSGLPPAGLAARQAVLSKILAARNEAVPGVDWVVTFPPSIASPDSVFTTDGFTVRHLRPAT